MIEILAFLMIYADITLEIINEYNDEICLISILNDSAKRKLEGLQL